jgi:hypothetical protein
MATTWKITKQRAGFYECHDGTRLRAYIEKGRGGWAVIRVNSKGNTGGIDPFKTFGDCKVFVTNRPGVWGEYSQPKPRDRG